MAEPALLLLDLGDLFTKGLMPGPHKDRRLRFPSAVARRLLSSPAEGSLLVDASDQDFPAFTAVGRRPARAHSYPGAAAILSEAAVRAPGVGRYTGWQAVTYGADRQLLGDHPTLENVEALVNKALMLLRLPAGEVELGLIVDSGVKARAVLDYARRSPRRVAFATGTLRGAGERRIDLEVRSRVLDAAACAAAALPDDLDPARVGRVALLDIGDRRAKLAIVSASGCEHQEDIDSLGVREAVRRVLRDGQGAGVLEDEFAVIRALERSDGDVIEVAGRSYAIGEARRSALDSLEQELARATRRALLGFYSRCADPCRAVAICGGGAALVGQGLAQRLERELGIETWWIAPRASFHLLEGAAKIACSAP